MEQKEIKNNSYSVPIAIVVAGVMLAGAIAYRSSYSPTYQAYQLTNQNVANTVSSISPEEEVVIPTEGVILPVSWGNLGLRLASTGVIDVEKLKAVYVDRSGFTNEYGKLLLYQNDDKLKITKENAGYLLNLFWALGLANSNSILDSGEMTDSRYGGAQNFAGTAGWTIARGNPMDHYSKHMFVSLTADQQMLVDKISRGIYRPCCNNSTHFPDCNHGVAMLGLLELMASQGVSETDMWQTALTVNSYWFPDTYMTIASYMKDKGVEWKDVNAQEMLGINYSSASGYAKIAGQVREPEQRQGGSGCGIDTNTGAQIPDQVPQKQAGCGV
ncbi:MAG: hypothetical protein Q7R72_00855 [bacterium]|nr:hypothetical protein [bacterium]